MHGYDGTGTEELVGAAIAAAVAEQRALGVALAVAAVAAAESDELPASTFVGLETGFWGRAAMAQHAAGPLGLLRRA